MTYDKRYWNKAASFYSELGLPWQWLKDGYIPIIVELKKTLGDLRGKYILDHGCGAGKITRLLKFFYGAEVRGVDPSEEMIQEAKRADPDGQYKLLEENFPWSDNIFDGIMSNWVFLCIGTMKEMDKAAREIYRVMNSNGLFVMLVNNEKYIGKKASTYQNGKANKTYNPGDEIIVTYFKNEKEIIEFKDFYWPTETYCSVMEKAGFKDVTSYVPKLNSLTIKEIELLKKEGVFPEVDYQALIDERPTVIISGKKL
jgi:ubiquinone/menaquinone biosynthesis C-methylase UbiE